jgi:tRNA(Arg) A34 adenosine deaminase TadA
MSAEPMPEQMIRHLRRANDVARRAMGLGRHPFGATLVGPDHEQVLAEQGNVSAVEHAESALARTAAANHLPEFLWTCTLYTNFEPCAMCSGTIYWANIGRVVFGVSEARLLGLTGNHPENPTLSVPAKYVFDHGQKAIRLYGPIADVEIETLDLHKEFWKK